MEDDDTIDVYVEQIGGAPAAVLDDSLSNTINMTDDGEDSDGFVIVNATDMSALSLHDKNDSGTSAPLAAAGMSAKIDRAERPLATSLTPVPIPVEPTQTFVISVVHIGFERI